MHSIEHLDFSRLVMKGPNPVGFDEELPHGQQLRFVNPIMGYKQLKLKIPGRVTEDLKLIEYKDGRSEYKFKFKPKSSHIPNLERLETIFEKDTLTEKLRDQIGFPEGKYTLKFLVGEKDSQISIKMQPDGNGGFSADSNLNLDIEGHMDQCKTGKNIEIEAVVTYYFRDGGSDEDTYGTSLRLLEVDYEQNEKPKPVKKKVNKQ